MSLLRSAVRDAQARLWRVTETEHVSGLVVGFHVDQLASGDVLDVAVRGPGGLSPLVIAALLRGVADALDPEISGSFHVRRAPFDAEDIEAMAGEEGSP